MSKQRTYAAIILDKSSSMSGTQAQTVQGFNEHVQQFKIDSKDQDILVSLVTFNGDVYEHLWNEPAANLAEAVVEDYRPGGSTALRDAVGYTIDKLSETAQVDENTSFLVIIISDGYENSSKHVTAEALKAKIDERQKTGDWTFTYMGCDERYLKELSEQTAIPISNMAAWSNQDSVRTRGGMDESRKKMKKFFTARSCGVKGMSAGYHSDNLEMCANYTDVGVGDSGSVDPADANSIGDTFGTPDVTIGSSAQQPMSRGYVSPATFGGNVIKGQNFGTNVAKTAVTPEHNEGAGYFAAKEPVKWQTSDKA